MLRHQVLRPIVLCLAFTATFLATVSAQTLTGACANPSLWQNNAIYTLTPNNTIHVIAPNAVNNQSVKVMGVSGNLFAINYRPLDGKLYGLTDSGNLYQINVSPGNAAARLISIMNPRFMGGFQSLANFNPTGTSALRIMGSNDQNFAITNANGGLLNQTVVQTPLKYAAGDVNVTIDPNITAGAYDSKFANALQTTFYGLDYDLNTLVTIADRNASGSSNTAGGQLKTIGNLIDAQGNQVDISPTAGFDITTMNQTTNVGVLVTNQSLYCIDMAQVNPNLPLGRTANVPVQFLTKQSRQLVNMAGNANFVDVAVVPIVQGTVGADVSVSASSTPATVRNNQRVTYTVRVTNRGPNMASGVSLQAMDDQGAVRFTSASPSQGQCSPFNRCQLGDIVSGASVTVTFTGQLFSSGSDCNTNSQSPLGVTDKKSLNLALPPSPTCVLPVTTTFNVTSQSTDPVLNNNASSVLTTLVIR